MSPSYLGSRSVKHKHSSLVHNAQTYPTKLHTETEKLREISRYEADSDAVTVNTAMLFIFKINYFYLVWKHHLS